MTGPLEGPARSAERPAARRLLRIGITGPIGCGKSTVLGWLAARGAQVIDADEVAREVMAPGSAVAAEIVSAFGSNVGDPGGRLDRAALAALVFHDPDQLRRREAIVHPVVRERILATIRGAVAAEVPIIALEAIRLVEAGYPSMLDEVWLVTCDPGAQRDRLAARGLAPAEAVARIAAQAGLAERIRPVATRVIDTSGSLAATRAAVDAALKDASKS
jgi:dephospho-CoA kinase